MPKTTEYQEEREENAARPTCPMCGVPLAAAEDPQVSDVTPAEVIRLLAHMHDEDPLQVTILLRRVLSPTCSDYEIARTVGCAPNTIRNHAARLLENFPALGEFLGVKRPRSIGQQRRRQGRKSSKYRGVSWRPSRRAWRAQITYKARSLYVGTYPREIEAARAYNEKATELFGDAAILNDLHNPGKNGN